MAPDINPGYPSGGEKIGPAWEVCWEILGDGRWHKGTLLSNSVAERSDVIAKTVYGLLWQAAKKGIIDVEKRFAGRLGDGRAIRANWYRIAR